METKPYRIQSPEAIAKDYGGNKQKIAEAMQMGVVDPTAGVLAGMFIDKMRAAQMQEMAPQQTVAQQVMAPQPAAPQMPAGGLGATPQAAPQMPPQMPPQAAPSMDPAAMGAAPPQGMAGGGLYEAPYMKDGGLSELPIPDTMFDEQRDGSYGGGGLVAFAGGSPGTFLEDFDAAFAAQTPEGEDEIVVEGDVEPESIHGIYRDPVMNKTELLEQLYKPERKYSDKLAAFYDEVMSQEGQKKRRKQDMWQSLAELGFGIASSKSPNLLGAIGESGAKAAAAMAERTKERRAEQRDAIKTLAQQEGFNNKEALEIANAALNLSGKYADLRESGLNRDQQLFIQKMQDATQRWQTSQQVGASMFSTREGAAASRYAADAGARRETTAAVREAGRYFDALTEESPQLKQMRIRDPLGYTQRKMQYIKEYVGL